MRMSDVKVNYKGKYDTYVCQVCKIDDESQEHIISKCKIINRKEEENMKYEDIFFGNVIKKVKIARKFISNIKIREKLKS